MAYTTRRPSAWWQYLDAPTVPAPNMTVYPVERRDTGLVDKHGNKIWHEPEPIGFPLGRRVIESR